MTNTLNNDFVEKPKYWVQEVAITDEILGIPQLLGAHARAATPKSTLMEYISSLWTLMETLPRHVTISNHTEHNDPKNERSFQQGANLTTSIQVIQQPNILLRCQICAPH